jgi:type II protein arginine methyltransferase
VRFFDLVGDGAAAREPLSPAAQAMFDAFARAPDAHDAAHLVGLAQVLRARGWPADAARLCLRALSQAEPGAEADARARELLGKGIPRWHIPLLHDHVRAEAYDRAIRRAVRPGMLVLDVGTGSGVLAMMAARAGAEHVVACEQDPVLALVARENVRRNGFADRVTIVAKHSKALVIGKDLPRRADLLVSEIVSNQLLGEGVLDAAEHARADLLTGDAMSIPSGGEILVALAEGNLGRRAPLGDVAGLDLSFVNVLRGAQQAEPAAGLSTMSKAMPILSFDFSGRHRDKQGSGECVLTAGRSGTAVGLLQSMRLRLDEHQTLSTEVLWPGAAWGRQVYCFREPRAVEAGQEVNVSAAYARDALLIWTA